ncbi:DUF4251 domain-containing protein [Muriicola sp. SD30]|uniref:DUF4251 domain-containing protein n=1 Tax=Muriicola sp. SD30 TaxID=3240936 RepID=UPI00350F5C4B
MKYICATILMIALISGCGSLPDKKASEASVVALDELVAGRSFEIVSTWAFPLMTRGITSVANSGLLLPGSNANRIDLIGNSNYLRVEGDSVFVSLPYFGERQIGGRYGDSDVGIKVERIPQEYQVEKDEKKDSYRIEFRIKDEIESLQFFLTLFPSGKADINVNSTHRSSIRYSGTAKPLAEE